MIDNRVCINNCNDKQAAMQDMIQKAVAKAVSQAVAGMEVEVENLHDEVCLLRKLVESLRKDDRGELKHVLLRDNHRPPSLSYLWILVFW